MLSRANWHRSFPVCGALLLIEGQEYGHSFNIAFGTMYRRQTRDKREANVLLKRGDRALG